MDALARSPALGPLLFALQRRGLASSSSSASSPLSQLMFFFQQRHGEGSPAPPADRIQRQVLELRESEPSSAAEALPRSQLEGGRFVHNRTLFPDHKEHGLGDVLKWRRNVVATPRPTAADLAALPVLPLDTAALERPPTGQVQLTWVGHATVLCQMDGWNILCDPILSKRCSPTQWAGPKRIVPSPMRARDLTIPIDVVLISHNHYDHLDVTSVLALAERTPAPLWFVPLGLKKWFLRRGIRNVVEMDWSEEAVVPKAEGKARSLKLVSVPCQHFTSRGPTDRNKTLWTSWLCSTKAAGPTSEGEGASFFFGGDTGYCGDIFKRVGKVFGPIDVSAIPIGAYGHATERWFMKPVHMNPSEAVKMHRDIRSRRSVGIHWGTFLLTAEPILEPPKLLRAAVAEAGLQEEAFEVLKHGETRAFGGGDGG